MKHQQITAAEEAFHIVSFAEARNEWLNEFALLEIEINRCIGRVNGTPFERGTPLTNKVRELAKSKASPTCSKMDISKLQNLCASCEPLLALRATLVHSQMVNGRRGVEPIAIFQNIADVLSGTPLCAVLDHREFERSRAELGKLARGYAQIAVRASAPPQPKPGAAAGP